LGLQKWNTRRRGLASSARLIWGRKRGGMGKRGSCGCSGLDLKEGNSEVGGQGGESKLPLRKQKKRRIQGEN